MLKQWIVFFARSDWLLSQWISWIIETLDRKRMSRGLISYRRLVGSCSKMAFVMHDSQKVACKLFMIRGSIIYHFWSVFITSFWVGQINCVWGSLLVLGTKTVFFWIALFFKPKMDLISSIIVFGFLEIQSNNVPVDDKSYQDIFQIKLINHTPVLVCDMNFCFQQDDNVTRQSYF